MTSVYIFGVIIAVLFISGLVLAPILEDEPADPDAPDGDASPEERREAALDALEELQFEHETGKLSDEDFRRLKSKYARAAVAARHQEEGAAGAAGAAAGAAAGESGESTGARQGGEGGAEAERAAEEPPPSSERAASHCPECGAEVAEDARFCGQCGTELPT